MSMSPRQGPMLVQWHQGLGWRTHWEIASTLDHLESKPLCLSYCWWCLSLHGVHWTSTFINRPIHFACKMFLIISLLFCLTLRAYILLGCTTKAKSVPVKPHQPHKLTSWSPVLASLVHPAHLIFCNSSAWVSNLFIAWSTLQPTLQ